MAGHKNVFMAKKKKNRFLDTFFEKTDEGGRFFYFIFYFPPKQKRHVFFFFVFEKLRMPSIYGISSENLDTPSPLNFLLSLPKIR